ncbi:MAG: phytanoyl-CoA dioxygenase [Streptomycetaceae bacterium]|nr:phytanoyl-CoA dioxygenase [Streptomycetaceae bacterium]
MPVPQTDVPSSGLVGAVSLPDDLGVFPITRADELAAFFAAHGYAVLRGLWPEDTLRDLERSCVAAQRELLAGRLDSRHGSVELVEEADGAGTPATAFANYVAHLTDVSPEVRAAALAPQIADLVQRMIGPCVLLEDEPFGVVYQDARPGRDSGYSRIGWHSDWQSGPHLDRWPSVAFTVHLDGTGPDNGFLRVVPGSHLWATPAPFRNANGVPVPDGARPTGGHTDAAPPYEMPLGFAKVAGEAAVYCERGDILFHDAYLWHSAARATVDDAVRRHIRGGWYAGPLDPQVTIADFVKNAAR